jgi:hypothetical protein
MASERGLLITLVFPNVTYAAAIETALATQRGCAECAKNLLEQPFPETFTRCIHLLWECAAACEGISKALLRDSEFALEWVTLCTNVCNACVRECEEHFNQHTLQPAHPGLRPDL